MPNLLLISSSRYAHGEPLAHAAGQIQAHQKGVGTVLFIPYARPGGLTHEAYSGLMAAPMAKVGFGLEGIEAYPDPREAVARAEAIYIGGGNSFLLLKGLYENGLIEPIRKRVAEGMPYMGTSAGSNVAGLTIGTTNDMPIVYPPSFDALKLASFNINPHYPREEDAHHMGETREDRITEFHLVSENVQPVIALREDGMLVIKGNSMSLSGTNPCRLFRQGLETEDFPAGADLSFLLKNG